MSWSMPFQRSPNPLPCGYGLQSCGTLTLQFHFASGSFTWRFHFPPVLPLGSFIWQFLFSTKFVSNFRNIRHLRKSWISNAEISLPFSCSVSAFVFPFLHLTTLRSNLPKVPLIMQLPLPTPRCVKPAFVFLAILVLLALNLVSRLTRLPPDGPLRMDSM